MPRFNPIKNSFTAGEISPRLEGRDDLDQFKDGLRQSLNGIVLPHGGFQRRSGTRFVGETKDMSKQVRLIPFVIDVATSTSYVLEVGDGYVRFYLNGAILKDSGGNIVELTSSPWTENDLDLLQWAQSANVLWVVHPNHPPYKITRNSTTSFSLDVVTFRNGKAPLQPVNLDLDNKVTPSSTTSDPVTLTWDKDIGLTSAKDVGRVVRVLEDPNEIAYYEITGVNSAKEATANTRFKDSGHPAATDNWALGAVSDTEGFNAITFHEGRLAYGGTANNPERFFLSVSDSFDDFDIGDPIAENAGNDDRAIERPATGGDVNTISWMVSANERMIIGTATGEFLAQGSNNDTLTPEGTVVRQVTKRGSIRRQPVVVDNQPVFIQRNGTKLRSFQFNVQQDSLIADNISIIHEHILNSLSAVDITYQQDMDSVIWVLREDGQLFGWTVENIQQITAVHRHELGGTFKGGPPQIETIATIPAPAGKIQDQVWMVVKRTDPNGNILRYVEALEDTFLPEITPQSDTLTRIAAVEQAFMPDSGLSLDNPIAISDITQANPGVVTTATDHGLSTNDTIRIRGVKGMTEVNQVSFTVTKIDATSFEIDQDTSGFDAYIASGTVRKEFDVFGGLGHLKGQTVVVLADGSPLPEKVVDSNGDIQLDRKASIVHAGLKNTFRGETERFVRGLGNPQQTDQGLPSRIQRISIKLHNTVGLSVATGPQPNLEDLEPLIFEDKTRLLNRAVPIFTGDKEVSNRRGWGDEPTVFFESTQPTPASVLAIMPRMESNER